jgi:hypothetical protein
LIGELPCDHDGEAGSNLYQCRATPDSSPNGTAFNTRHYVTVG